MPYHLAACNKDEPISCGERTPKKEPTDKFKVVWNILIDNEESQIGLAMDIHRIYFQVAPFRKVLLQLLLTGR